MFNKIKIKDKNLKERTRFKMDKFKSTDPPEHRWKSSHSSINQSFTFKYFIFLICIFTFNLIRPIEAKGCLTLWQDGKVRIIVLLFYFYLIIYLIF